VAQFSVCIVFAQVFTLHLNDFLVAAIISICALLGRTLQNFNIGSEESGDRTFVCLISFLQGLTIFGLLLMSKFNTKAHNEKVDQAQEQADERTDQEI